MIRFILPAFLCLVGLSSQLSAEPRQVLGHARLFSNDALGDGQDRWRSGSYFVSRITGPDWQGTAPAGFGQVLEYRLRSEIIAPENLVAPVGNDRRYAGVLALGVHTHLTWQGLDTSLGADLVMTGEQTGVGAFQREVHDLLGLDKPTVLGAQIGNAVYPGLTGELGRSFALGQATTLRPFVEAQAGVETLVRVGGDLVVGQYGSQALMIRDVVTGQRVRGAGGPAAPGISLTLGADVAHVFDSAYLPDGGSAPLSDSRERLRAGVHWQGEKSEIYYGLTWLGQEFDTQPDGQLLGSLRVQMRF